MKINRALPIIWLPLLAFWTFLVSIHINTTPFALSNLVPTVFYVLVVPVISYFIFSKKMHWSIWPSVFICILGGLLLSELNNYSVRLGDTLGILSAFCWEFIFC